MPQGKIVRVFRDGARRRFVGWGLVRDGRRGREVFGFVEVKRGMPGARAQRVVERVAKNPELARSRYSSTWVPVADDAGWAVGADGESIMPARTVVLRFGPETWAGLDEIARAMARV